VDWGETVYQILVFLCPHVVGPLSSQKTPAKLVDSEPGHPSPSQHGAKVESLSLDTPPVNLACEEEARERFANCMASLVLKGKSILTIFDF